jgi:redox-sensing transcriptional repressor
VERFDAPDHRTLRSFYNNQDRNLKVPMPTLERLAAYLRLLIEQEISEVTTISSKDVERQTGISAAQFRKDLSFFGEFGRPGVGYNVGLLKEHLAKILKVQTRQPVVIVGAGNLGAALSGYDALGRHGFDIVGIFDISPAIVGHKMGKLTVSDIRNLGGENKKLGARIGIIAVPPRAAQDVADLLVAAGVGAILNFAPVALRVPDEIVVRDVCFIQELAVLSYHLGS